MGASGAATTVNMETATLTGKLISIITSAWIVMMTWKEHNFHLPIFS